MEAQRRFDEVFFEGSTEAKLSLYGGSTKAKWSLHGGSTEAKCMWQRTRQLNIKHPRMADLQTDLSNLPRFLAHQSGSGKKLAENWQIFCKLQAAWKPVWCEKLVLQMQIRVEGQLTVPLASLSSEGSRSPSRSHSG